MRRPRRRFYFRLARELGMTVGEMLGRMSAREMSEWMAFAEIEPFGAYMEDIRAGTIASTIANVHRRAGAAAVKPIEMVPWADDTRHCDEGMKIERFFKNMGLTVIDKTSGEGKARGEQDGIQG